MAAVMGAQGHFGVSASLEASTEEYEFTASTLKIDEELLDAAGIRGTRSHQADRVRQNTRAPGFSVTMQLNSVELDAWLPRILGGTESADAFPLAETLPSFGANFDCVAKRIYFSGCKVSKAVFSSSQGQPLNVTLDVEALDVAISATTFATLTISLVGPYIHSDVVATVASSIYSFRDVSLTIDNALDAQRFFNSQVRASLPEKDRIISWALDGPYGDNSALYGLASSGVTVVAKWTLGGRSLEFTSTGVGFPRLPPTLSGRDEIMLPIQGVARKMSTTMELTTVNDSSP